MCLRQWPPQHRKPDADDRQQRPNPGEKYAHILYIMFDDNISWQIGENTLQFAPTLRRIIHSARHISDLLQRGFINPPPETATTTRPTAGNYPPPPNGSLP